MDVKVVECANVVHAMVLGDSYETTTSFEKTLRDSIKDLYEFSIAKKETSSAHILVANIQTKRYTDNGRENGYNMRINFFANKITNNLQFSYELWFNETRIFTFSKGTMLGSTPKDDYELLVKYQQTAYRILDVVDYAYFFKTAIGKTDLYDVEICPYNRDTFITSANKLFAIKVTYRPTQQKLTFIHVIESGVSLRGDDFLVLNNDTYKALSSAKGMAQFSSKMIRLFNAAESGGWYTHVKRCVSYCMTLFEE